MTNDLKINGLDAYRQWGIRMGDGFLIQSVHPRL